MHIKKIKAGGINIPDIKNHVGEVGLLFYDQRNGLLRLGDGHTPGGLPVQTVFTATTATLGLVKIGNNLSISADGTLNAAAGGNANTGNFVFTNSQASVSNNSDITVVTNANTWTFGSDGATTFPNNAIKQVNGTDLSIATTGVIGQITATNVTIISSGTNYLDNSSYATDYPNTIITTLGGPSPLVNGGFLLESTEIFTVGDIITIPAGIQGNTTATLQVTSTLPYSWSFANTGQLNLPRASNGNARIQSADDIDILSENSLWTFGTNGVLTLPGGNTRIGDFLGNDAIITNTGTSFVVASQGTNGYVALEWVDNIENLGSTSTQIAAVVVNSPVASSSGTVQIITGLVTGGPTAEYTWEFGADGNLTAPGHLLPNADLAYDLGSTTTQWRSIYVGTGTIFIGGVALGVNADNFVTVDGNPIITVNTAGSLTLQGDTHIGFGTVTVSDTAPPTDIEGAQWFNTIDGRTYVSHSGAWVDASPTVVPAPGTYLQDITIDGSTLNINGGTLTISNTGTLLVNGSEVTGSGTGSSTHIEYTDGQSQYTSTVDLGYNFEVDTHYAHLNINGNGDWEIGSNAFDTKIFSTDDPGNEPKVIVVRAGDDDWTFGPMGLLTLPDGGTITEGAGPFTGAIKLTPAGGANAYQALMIYPTAGAGDGDHIHLTAGGGETDLYLGSDIQYVKVDHSGTIVVGTLGANTSTWTFGIDGILTLSTASTILGNSSDPNVYIETATTATTSTWTFGTNGILTLPAATPVIKGGGTGTDVTVVASTGSNTSTWTFAADGGITFPDSTVQTTAWPGGNNSSVSTTANNSNYFNIGNFINNGSLDINYTAFTGDYGIDFDISYQAPLDGTKGVTVGAVETPLILSTGTVILKTDISSSTSTWTFGTDGGLTFPDSTVQTTAWTGTVAYSNITGTPAVVNKTSGAWTLATGSNTVSITVPLNSNYQMWVNGNIPNGIVEWNATVNVSNPNVPAIGSQYAWYYAAGNALVLTAIPNQIVGTVGVISTSNSYVGTTANVFTFGITNNSTATQVINWGYTTL